MHVAVAFHLVLCLSPPLELVHQCRWGPQEEDTQKYKRRQKLYLSDRVDLCCQQQQAIPMAARALHSTAFMWEACGRKHCADQDALLRRLTARS